MTASGTMKISQKPYGYRSLPKKLNEHHHSGRYSADYAVSTLAEGSSLEECFQKSEANSAA